MVLISMSTFSIVNGELINDQSDLSRFAVSWSYGQNSFCSGVIISNRHVLSAAHCAGPSLNQIKFGIEKPIFINVLELDIHPNYRPELFSWHYPNQRVNDLVILTLEKEIPIGYRAIDIYQQINTPGETILIGIGKESIDGAMGTLRSRGVEVVDYLVQSGEWIVSQAACGGDSGGPLVFRSSNQYLLLGVTSRSDKRSDLGCLGPSVNTDLIHQRDWINSILSK